MPTLRVIMDLPPRQPRLLARLPRWQLAKTQICTYSTLFCTFLCRCFARLKCRFARLKRETSYLHIIFMEELSYVLTKNVVVCFPVRLYFFHTPHFHLTGRWHFLFSHRCYEIFMFFFQENSSRLVNHSL